MAHNPFLDEERELEERYSTGSEEVVFLPPAVSPTPSVIVKSRGSTPSTQKSIPPPTTNSPNPTFIITTTTETPQPSPIRRVHSFRRLEDQAQILQSEKL